MFSRSYGSRRGGVPGGDPECREGWDSSLDPQRWVTPQTSWLPGEKGTDDLSGFLGPGFPLSSLLAGLKWLQKPEQKLSRGGNTGISSCDEESLEFHLEEDSKGEHVPPSLILGQMGD